MALVRYGVAASRRLKHQQVSTCVVGLPDISGDGAICEDQSPNGHSAGDIIPAAISAPCSSAGETNGHGQLVVSAFRYY